MNLNEITSTKLKDLELTQREYNRIISDLKSRAVGNKTAASVLNQIENMWNRGERLTKNYKDIIKQFDINL